MNSESERSLSLEELRQRNMPPPAPPAPLPLPEQHPTTEEWDELLEMLSALYRLTATQYDFLQAQRVHPLQAQMSTLTKEVSAMREMIQKSIQQAGNKKERRFSLPHISLPQPSWVWLMFPAILVGLGALWYGSVTILRALGM